MMPDPESLNAGMGAVGAGGGIGAALTAIYHKWSSGRHMERVYDKISSLEAKLRKAAEDRAAEAEADAAKPDSVIADELYKRAARKD